jgi:hypothetical protein
LTNGDESFFVEGEAIGALGNSTGKEAFEILVNGLERQNTYLDIIPIKAIAGLVAFAKNEQNKDMVPEIISSLIKKSRYGNSNAVREYATLSLVDFVLVDGTINQQVFDHLMKLLYDTWVHVRKNAYADFGNALAYDKIMNKHIDSNIVNQVIAN